MKPGRCGHCAPLVGAVLRALDVPLDVSQRLFLFTTARGVLAGGGPARHRRQLPGAETAVRVRAGLDEVLRRCGDLEDEAVAQTAPVLDLLQAAHDRLYSRLFQS